MLHGGLTDQALTFLLTLPLLDVLDWRWGQLTAVFAFGVAFLTFMGMLGVRWQRFRSWMGPSIREMLGIEALAIALKEHYAFEDARWHEHHEKHHGGQA